MELVSPKYKLIIGTLTAGQGLSTYLPRYPASQHELVSSDCWNGQPEFDRGRGLGAVRVTVNMAPCGATQGVFSDRTPLWLGSLNTALSRETQLIGPN